VNGRVLRCAATVVVAVVLVLGAVTDAGAAVFVKSPTATSTECTQLRRRLAGAPATLRRVDVALAELRAHLAEVRLPVRRTILEQRIERLEQLRSALQAKITQARTACDTTGATTT